MSLPSYALSVSIRSAVDIEESLDCSLDLFVLTFAGVLKNDSSILVDDVLRGPIFIVIGFPGCVVIVLRNRIGNAVAP